MRYVKLIIYGFLLVQSYVLNAQVLDTDSWHEGEVYLTNGEVIRGKLTYNLENENILIEREGTIKAFNARQVDFFEFVDNRLSMIRSFYSLPYASKEGDYEIPMFFELLKYTDEICLLSREYRVLGSAVNTSQQSFYMPNESNSKVVVVEDYYVLNKDKKLCPLTGDDEALLLHMNDKAPIIEDFIKENNLSLSRRPDMLRIFFYYEKLNHPDEIVSLEKQLN